MKLRRSVRPFKFAKPWADYRTFCRHYAERFFYSLVRQTIALMAILKSFVLAE